jgi:hypothetical protein
MFRNWFRFGDAEVVNNTRVSKYVENGLKPVGGVVPRCDDCPDIWEATGDEEYDTPVLDGAPWVREEDPDSLDFAGVFATAVTGLGGSTIKTEVTERVSDGGMVGSRRAESRVIQVSADIVGRTPAATAVGLEWLSAALHPPCSSSGGCQGEVLHLFSACPETCFGQTDPDSAFVTTELPLDTMSVERGTTSTITAAPRTNVVLNPSFEIDTNADGIADNWNADNGGTNGGITRTILPISKAQRIVSSAQDNNVNSYAGVSTNSMPLAPGAAFARAKVVGITLPAGHEAILTVQCRNSSNAVISTVAKTATSSGIVELVFTAPAGTTNAMMYLRHRGSGTGPATAVRVETNWDEVMLVQGAPMDYFTGDTVDTPAYTYAWTGTPNASTSTATGSGNWLSFVHTGGATPGRIITGLMPGICDEVTVSWLVSSTNAQVTMQMLDSTGRVVLQTDSVSVSGSTTLSLTVDPTPEFPGDWRTAILVTGDVAVRALVSARPVLAPEECIEPYRRTFHNVVTIDGPKVVEEKTFGDTTDGSSIWSVEWTWVATEPNAWHEPTPLITTIPGRSSSPPPVYAAPGIQISTANPITGTSTQCPRPAASFFSSADNVNVPALILPPSAPVLSDPGVVDNATGLYWRRFIEIPAALMPAGLGALSWVFDNDDKAKLGIRVRVYEKGTDPAFVMEPECSFIQEFYIDYLKGNQTLYIDGPSGEIYVVDDNGDSWPAERNIRGTYGGPFDPQPLGCGRGYVIAVDIPNTYLATGGSEYVSGQPQGTIMWSLDLTRRA